MKRLYRSIRRSLGRTLRRSRKKRVRRRTKKSKPKKTKRPKKPKKPKKTKRPKKRKTKKEKLKGEMDAAGPPRLKRREKGSEKGPVVIYKKPKEYVNSLENCFESVKKSIKCLAVDFDWTLCNYQGEKGKDVLANIIKPNVFDDFGGKHLLEESNFIRETELIEHIRETSVELLAIMSGFDGPILLVTRSDCILYGFC